MIAARTTVDVLVTAIGTEKPTLCINFKVGRGTRRTACLVVHRGDYTPWNLAYFRVAPAVVTFDGLSKLALGEWND
jgi:hypothetical protein